MPGDTQMAGTTRQHAPCTNLTPAQAATEAPSSASNGVSSSRPESVASGVNELRLTSKMADVMCKYVTPMLPAFGLSELRASCSQLQLGITADNCEQLAKQKALAETFARGHCNTDASCWLIPPTWDSIPRQVAKDPDGLLGSSKFICQLWEKSNSASKPDHPTYSLLVTEIVSGHATQMGFADYSGPSFTKDATISIDWLTSDQLLVRIKEEQAWSVAASSTVSQPMQLPANNMIFESQRKPPTWTLKACCPQTAQLCCARMDATLLLLCLCLLDSSMRSCRSQTPLYSLQPCNGYQPNVACPALQ